MYAAIQQKENGFVVEVYNGESREREILVEGKDPKKIGVAVLAAFAKPRAPYKKKNGVTA